MLQLMRWGLIPFWTAAHLDSSSREMIAADFALLLQKPIALFDLFDAVERLLNGRTAQD